MPRNTTTLKELNWRKTLFSLFTKRRPLIARYFDWSKAEHYYHEGYTPGETVIFILNSMGLHVSEEDYFELWGK